MKRSICYALLLTFAAAPLVLAVNAFDRLEDSREVFQDIMNVTETSIPQDLLEKAHCLVIVPSTKRAGLGIGGQYGVGVAMCRLPGHYGWTGPSTVKVEGGSFGPQIGAGETDIIMLVMNQTGANKLMKSKFTLGGEAAAMAGPVGRQASAETDPYLRAEILSYSRSRGLFAGAVLKGSTLRPVEDSNRKLYGRKVRHEDILKGRIPCPPVATSLVATVTRYSSVEKR